MRLGSLRYLIKQGWHNMAANRLMTFASIGVLTACLLITGIASLLSVNVQRVVDYLGSQNEIVVYILEDASDEEQTALGTAIDAIANVDTAEYVSKQDALEQMKEWLGEYSNLLDGYDDVLLASYRVTVVELEQMGDTYEQLRQLPAVESVTAPSELAGVILTIRNAVTYGGWALVAILGIVSIIIISNTIRLTVFARRREISIMKYVGATNAFIRLPFFVEGMTVGIISGLLASGIVCGAYYLVIGYINDSTNLWVRSITTSLYTLNDVWPVVVVAFVVFGMLIGGVGSANSIRKHLKV